MTLKENNCLRWSELEGSLVIKVPLLSFQTEPPEGGQIWYRVTPAAEPALEPRPLGSQAWTSPHLASHVRAAGALSGLEELSCTGPDLFGHCLGRESLRRLWREVCEPFKDQVLTWY